MAKRIHSIVVLLLVFNLLISTSMAGRDIPSNNPDDIKHPDMFFSYDRGYLIPGLGRGIKPKSKKGFNPFTYNPITGNNNGIPEFTNIPTFGGVGGGPHLPGGDDTLVPNPGFEVPSPEGIGSTPVSARP
ncbi:hypothetical protein L6452_19035 [Arctium lappa]|uniref:Uncharacterized protein n=1 Tax=Arctium lappa TaxID=4217 RepID=A0ACB9B8B7_ARCLA|nr:hypothetical protein L6452_19035 [Arctium lappa]